MPTSASHVRKRQFQPSNQTSLNSYFSRSLGDSAPKNVSSPPLPVETQASLLSVGMRVRKSVPEGYKTHKTLGSTGFPFISSAPTPALPQSSPYREAGAKATRELMPFCGLHKTGGLAAQKIPPSSAPTIMMKCGPSDAAADDDSLSASQPPRLSMSQETVFQSGESFASVDPAASRKKRSFEEEIEGGLDAYFDELGDPEDILHVERPIAPLKKSMRNNVLSPGIDSFQPWDFEDATFLSPIEGMDVDH